MFRRILFPAAAAAALAAASPALAAGHPAAADEKHDCSCPAQMMTTGHDHREARQLQARPKKAEDARTSLTQVDSDWLTALNGSNGG